MVKCVVLLQSNVKDVNCCNREKIPHGEVKELKIKLIYFWLFYSFAKKRNAASLQEFFHLFFDLFVESLDPRLVDGRAEGRSNAGLEAELCGLPAEVGVLELRINHRWAAVIAQR